MILATWSQFRAVFMPGAPIGLDGVPAWNPTAVVTSTIAFTDPLAFPWLIQIDGTNDTTPGTDRYDWYLSQRTDDPTKQYFELQRNDTNAPTVTNSGKVKIARTALSTTLYPTLSTAALLALFKDLDLYVYARAPQTVQHRLLEEVLFQ